MDEDGFQVFWDLYPRKVAKLAAMKAWKKIDRDEIPQITAAIEAYKMSGLWDDPQFIPHPATFLNGRRWEDEVPGLRTCDRETRNALYAGANPFDHLVARKRLQ